MSVLTIDNLKMNEITLCNITKKDNILTIDLGYESNLIFLYLDTHDIIKLNDDMIVIDITQSDKVKNFFNNLDNYILNEIQNKSITKIYNLKNYVFTQTVSNYKDRTNNKYNILRLQINNTSEYYVNKHIRLDSNDIIKYRTNKCHGKIICEISNIVFNMDNKNIYINLIARQIKLKQNINKNISLPYSFIDTEIDNDNICDKLCDKVDDNYNISNNHINNILSSQSSNKNESDDENNIYKEMYKELDKSPSIHSLSSSHNNYSECETSENITSNSDDNL